jgi:hypothetical protein
MVFLRRASDNPTTASRAESKTLCPSSDFVGPALARKSSKHQLGLHQLDTRSGVAVKEPEWRTAPAEDRRIVPPSRRPHLRAALVEEGIQARVAYSSACISAEG